MHPKWGGEGAPIFVREYGGYLGRRQNVSLDALSKPRPARVPKSHPRPCSASCSHLVAATHITDRIVKMPPTQK